MATPAAARGGIFLGGDRKIQPVWRAIIFFALAAFLFLPLIGYLSKLIIPPPPGPGLHLTPTELTIAEIVNLLAALAATALFAWYEHRRIDSYGLPVEAVLKSPTWEGFAVGVVQAGVVAFAMFALGGMQVRGLALGGAAIVTWGLA